MTPPVSAAQLHARLFSALQPSMLEVIDESWQHAGHAGVADHPTTGGGTHFRVRIASQLFTGKRPVEKHRLVYDALHEFMLQGVHALAIETVEARESSESIETVPNIQTNNRK